MFEISTRLELNVLRGDTLAATMQQLSSFVTKNRIPTVVVMPELASMVVLDRSRFNATYKVICAVDFFDGRHFAGEKMRDLPQDCFMADGFEFRVTHGRSDKESLNELRALTEYVKQIDQTKEIRWALAMRTIPRDQLAISLQHMKTWPCSFIRSDINLVSPSATIDNHLDDIKFIRKHVATPIKISGDVNYDTILSLRGRAARFDVSLFQAKSILKEAKQINDMSREEVIYADVKDEEDE